MGGEDDGALPAQLADEPADLDPLVGVEPLGRLVEHQEVGAVEDGRGEAHPLAEALGQLADRPVVDVLDAGGGDGLVQRGPPVGAADVPEPGHVVQPLRDQHLGVERVVLGQVADPPLGLAPALGEGHAVEPDGPGVGLEVLGDHPHGGGLAGPVRAQEADHLAPVHAEGDLVYGGDPVEPLGDSFETSATTYASLVWVVVNRAGY